MCIYCLGSPARSRLSCSCSCPNSNTTDAIHVLTHKIKDAWRYSKVAVALFLNVQGAFPNTVKDQLIYNMKTLKVLTCYIKLTKKCLQIG